MARNLLARIGAATFLYVIEILLIGITSLASGVLIIYASIAAGHLFNRQRILATVGAFIALSTITQVLFVIVVAAFNAIPIPEHLFVSNNYNAAEPYVHLGMWFIILLTGLPALGYFLVTNYILGRRLNLE